MSRLENRLFLNFVHTLPRLQGAAVRRRLGAALLLALLALGGPAAVAPLQAQPAADAAVQQAPARVNINTADAETLQRALSGIGPSRAREIIRHREAYGPFASIEELTEVKGIGKATLDRNRSLLALE